jgi:hypothetical protein
MEISTKEWLTVVGMIDRLRWTSDMHGTMLTVLLLKLEEAEALTASQREQIEADWGEVYKVAEGREFLAHELRDPRAQKRVVLMKTAVVSPAHESLAEQLETEFEDMLQQASVKYRGELGQREGGLTHGEDHPA